MGDENEPSSSDTLISSPSDATKMAAAAAITDRVDTRTDLRCCCFALGFAL